jgi:V/A-type H+-transporting ATPase subunit E
LIGKASHELNMGYVYCNEKDSGLVKIMSGHFKFAGTINCIGGIVVESLDKTITLDYRYETIIEEIWIDSMKKVSEILFS